MRLRVGLGRDGVSFVGFADVQCGAIHVRVDGGGGNSQLVGGADNAYGNLAAVRDENLLEHFLDQRRSENPRFYRRLRVVADFGQSKVVAQFAGPKLLTAQYAENIREERREDQKILCRTPGWGHGAPLGPIASS